ncbi:hypothetical protein [Burkholderia cepacia]|nr:hypothetical protein [Burkholderia cepacia]
MGESLFRMQWARNAAPHKSSVAPREDAGKIAAFIDSKNLLSSF